MKIFVKTLIAGLLVIGLTGCFPIIEAPVIERQVLLVDPESKDDILTYRVNSGDTLYAISRLHGLTVPEVAAMNDIPPPYVIYAGQKLVVYRTVDQTGGSREVAETSLSSPPQTEGQPTSVPTDQTIVASTETEKDTKTTRLPEPSQSRPDPATTTTSSSSSPTTATMTPEPQDLSAGIIATTESEFSFAEVQAIQERAKNLPKGWVWPVSTQPNSPYRVRDKGLTYTLKEGTNVRAAASGRVTYAGSSVSDYKYMILVKTSDDLVVQYDFNVELEIKENDLVAKGDTIVRIRKPNEGESQKDAEIYQQLFFAIWDKDQSQNPNTVISSQ